MSVARASCSTCSSAPDRGAARRIPVDEQTPAPGEPLRVLRVAAEHAHPAAAALGVAADIGCRRRRSALAPVRARSPRRRAPPARFARSAPAASRRPSRRRDARARPRQDAQSQRAERARTAARRRPRRRPAPRAGSATSRRPEPTARAPARRRPRLRSQRRAAGREIPSATAGDLRPGTSRTPRAAPRAAPVPARTSKATKHVARQVEATADDRVDDDHERERQQPDEHRLPQAARPPEHGGERLRDVRVDARS